MQGGFNVLRRLECADVIAIQTIRLIGLDFQSDHIIMYCLLYDGAGVKEKVINE